ncbi:hypothetical protein CLOBY_28750 [Clostridium saccharobutylicum]|nr:hypothetical protein CLOBY_28750 [Clostridium saccharobutylicum]
MISVIKLTVLFDAPFWIGIFEIVENTEYKVCKVTFGAEPKDEETYEFILHKFYKLRFSHSILSLDNNFIEKNKIPKDYNEKLKRKPLIKE